MNRDCFFVHVCFSNATVSLTTVSTETMNMFHLEHETRRACQTYVACFVHVVCRFVEIEDIFQVWVNIESHKIIQMVKWKLGNLVSEHRLII